MPATDIKIKLIILPSLFFITILNSHAQRVFNLIIIDSLNNSPSKETRKIQYKKTFSDSLARTKELQNYLFTLYEKGFITASFTRFKTDSSTLYAYINLEDNYKWEILNNPSDANTKNIISQIGFKEKYFNNKPISYGKISKIFEKILRYCENNGYPFASVKLDSLHFVEPDTLSGHRHYNKYLKATINLEKNKKCTIDSIVVKGKPKISRSYLYNKLNIKPGSEYNEQLISNIPLRIKEIPFVREIRPHSVVFTKTQTKIILYLEDKKANQFDGFIGLVPADNITKKFAFTGDVKLKLQNSFKTGEIIAFNWKKLQTRTQDLNINYIQPFIWNSPFGLDLKFNLYKYDTVYLNVNRIGGVQYHLSATAETTFQAFIDNKKSSLISTKGLENLTTLPSYADYTSNIYGIGFKKEKLDNRFNPRNGWTLSTNIGAGNKTIKKNAKLNPVLYENIDLSTNQYKARLEFNFFVPLTQRNVMLLGVNGAYLYGRNIFENELFRIGGLNLLRGFDEESITATNYSVFTIEYRYLFEENSNIHLFFDAAYYEKNTIKEFVHDTPFGFGVGMSFETKTGIFTINYALGKQFDAPIYFKSSKIHFGIVNFF